MKFKKIEIQAFRAYQLKENATFDFSCRQGFADFVSIYAPNGFGKTSFYDAIEWCITNRIKRIDDSSNLEDALKTEREQNKLRGGNYAQWVVRNKFARQDLPTFVTVSTTSTALGDINNISPNVRKGASDYPKGNERNLEYRNVILSQDGIDAFLHSETPEERYAKFIGHFDQNNLDELYCTVNELIKENEIEINALKEKKNELEDGLSAPVDKQVTDQLNSLILKLNILGFEFPLFTEKENTKDFVVFTNRLASEYNAIFAGESGKKNTADALKIKLMSLLERQGLYDELKKNITEDNEQIVQIESRIRAIREYAISVDKMKTIEKEINVDKTRLKLLDTIIKNEVAYESISKDIAENNKSRILIQSKLLKQSSLLIKINNRIENLRAAEKKANEFIKQTRQSLLEAQQQTELYNRSVSYLQSLEKDFSSALSDQSTSQDELNQLTDQIGNLGGYQTLVQAGVYDFESDIADIIRLTATIKSLENAEQKLMLQRTDFNKNLMNLEEFQKNLSQLIGLGITIISNSQSSDCPLCNSSFESVDDLLAKVNNNAGLFLNNADLLNRKHAVEEQLHKTAQDKNIQVSQLTIFIGNELLAKKVRQNALSEKQNLLIKHVQQIQERMAVNQKAIENYSAEVIAKTISNLNGRLAELEAGLIRTRVNIERYTRLVEKLTIMEAGLRSEVSIIELNTSAKENDEAYRATNSLLALLNMNMHPFAQILSAKEMIITTISEKSTALQIQEEQNKAAVVANPDMDQTTLNSLMKDTKSKLRKHNKELTAIKNDLSAADIVEYTRENLVKLINDINEALSKFDEISRLQSGITDLRDRFVELEKYNNRVQQLKTAEKKFESRLHLEAELEINRATISSYIEQMIETFFFRKLINDIFNKIDAHPDYKFVEFSVDFSDTKPKLNVFITGKKSKELINPVLYFSTAQINILSLSIFLAKALNAKDAAGESIDCILIDDPVQSMDSINMLSVIDLLRSLVVNHNKQIILSTHDENFYKLIQKKIPTSHFSSKFFRLETFGKVVTEAEKLSN